MFVWVLRLIFLFAILTAIYVALARYSRWDRRKSLEAEFDAADNTLKPREEHIAEGLARYDQSLSKRLLLGVFVAPIAIIAILLIIAYYM
ncbi:MAG TPA: hypothetical protein VMY41_04480 [Thermohalobaculum sp.]|nr:hypothetical protein [Thermohalobaculum sp.]